MIQYNYFYSSSLTRFRIVYLNGWRYLTEMCKVSKCLYECLLLECLEQTASL